MTERRKIKYDRVMRLIAERKKISGKLDKIGLYLSLIVEGNTLDNSEKVLIEIAIKKIVQVAEFTRAG